MHGLLSFYSSVIVQVNIYETIPVSCSALLFDFCHCDSRRTLSTVFVQSSSSWWVQCMGASRLCSPTQLTTNGTSYFLLKPELHFQISMQTLLAPLCVLHLLILVIIKLIVEQVHDIKNVLDRPAFYQRLSTCRS